MNTPDLAGSVVIEEMKSSTIVSHVVSGDLEGAFDALLTTMIIETTTETTNTNSDVSSDDDSSSNDDSSKKEEEPVAVAVVDQSKNNDEENNNESDNTSRGGNNRGSDSGDQSGKNDNTNKDDTDEKNNDQQYNIQIGFKRSFMIACMLLFGVVLICFMSYRVLCKKRKSSKEDDLEMVGAGDLKDEGKFGASADRDMFKINNQVGILYVQPLNEEFEGEGTGALSMARLGVDNGIPVAGANNVDPNKHTMFNSSIEREPNRVRVGRQGANANPNIRTTEKEDKDGNIILVPIDVTELGHEDANRNEQPLNYVDDPNEPVVGVPVVHNTNSVVQGFEFNPRSGNQQNNQHTTPARTPINYNSVTYNRDGNSNTVPNNGPRGAAQNKQSVNPPNVNTGNNFNMNIIVDADEAVAIPEPDNTMYPPVTGTLVDNFVQQSDSDTDSNIDNHVASNNNNPNKAKFSRYQDQNNTNKNTPQRPNIRVNDIVVVSPPQPNAQPPTNGNDEDRARKKRKSSKIGLRDDKNKRGRKSSTSGSVAPASNNNDAGDTDAVQV
jgi:hypothetical protein